MLSVQPVFPPDPQLLRRLKLDEDIDPGGKMSVTMMPRSEGGFDSSWSPPDDDSYYVPVAKDFTESASLEEDGSCEHQDDSINMVHPLPSPQLPCSPTTNAKPEYTLQDTIDKLADDVENLQLDLIDQTELGEKGGGTKRAPPSRRSQQHGGGGSAAKRSNMAPTQELVHILPPESPGFRNVTSHSSLPFCWPPAPELCPTSSTGPARSSNSLAILSGTEAEPFLVRFQCPSAHAHSGLIRDDLTQQQSRTIFSRITEKSVPQSSLNFTGGCFHETLPSIVDPDDEATAIEKIKQELEKETPPVGNMGPLPMFLPKGPPSWLSQKVSVPYASTGHASTSGTAVPRTSSVSYSVCSPPIHGTESTGIGVCNPPTLAHRIPNSSSNGEFALAEVTQRNHQPLMSVCGPPSSVKFFCGGENTEDDAAENTSVQHSPEVTGADAHPISPNSSLGISLSSSSSSLKSIGSWSSGSERNSGTEQSFQRQSRHMKDWEGSDSSISSNQRDSGVYEVLSPPAQRQLPRQGSIQGLTAEEFPNVTLSQISSPSASSHQPSLVRRSSSGSTSCSREPDSTVLSPGTRCLPSPTAASPSMAQSPSSVGHSPCYNLPPTPMSPTGRASSPSMVHSSHSSCSPPKQHSAQLAATSPPSPISVSPQNQRSPSVVYTMVKNSPGGSQVLARSPVNSPAAPGTSVCSPVPEMPQVAYPSPEAVSRPVSSPAAPGTSVCPSIPGMPQAAPQSPAAVSMSSPSTPGSVQLEWEFPISQAIGDDGVWYHDCDGNNFLHYLSEENEEDAVQMLCQLRGQEQFLLALNEPNGVGETPLYSAVLMNRPKLTDAFLEVGANINCLCRFGSQDVFHTPLHLAVEKGFDSIVEILAESEDTSINTQRNPDNLTPLMVGLQKHERGHPRNDRTSIIQRLVDASPDFETKDCKSGKTPLMMAVETKDVNVVRLILESAGVENARKLINQHKMWNNASAVHIAAGLHNTARDVKEKMLQLLIQYGGDTSLRNNEGDTPNDYARNLIRTVATMK